MVAIYKLWYACISYVLLVCIECLFLAFLFQDWSFPMTKVSSILFFYCLVLRLENRASISDVRMEFQDLERCSIIHGFAKFHGRSKTDRLETSLTSDFPPGKLLQRQVRQTSMPSNHLEGVVCFSLWVFKQFILCSFFMIITLAFLLTYIWT